MVVWAASGYHPNKRKMDMTEFLPENSDRNIKLRQYRDALAISGGVVIAFSLWEWYT